MAGLDFVPPSVHLHRYFLCRIVRSCLAGSILERITHRAQMLLPIERGEALASRDYHQRSPSGRKLILVRNGQLPASACRRCSVGYRWQESCPAGIDLPNFSTSSPRQCANATCKVTGDNSASSQPQRPCTVTPEYSLNGNSARLTIPKHEPRLWSYQA